MKLSEVLIEEGPTQDIVNEKHDYIEIRNTNVVTMIRLVGMHFGNFHVYSVKIGN